MGFDVYFQLFDTARYRKVRRAARAFLQRGDPGPLLVELADARRRLPPDRLMERLSFGPVLYTRDGLEALVRRLERATLAAGGGPALERTFREEVIPTLVESCVAWRSRVDPSQTMSAGPLPELLSSQSGWLLDNVVMSGLAGDQVSELEFKHGAVGELLSRKMLARLERELAAIPRPRDPVVRDDLATFRRLVAAARAGKGRGLLRSMQ
jgi:hypothetical protein